ncbi:hypothetical protein D8674_024810 [Pyrus ussuriensis x Pyrus communis]|uniref:Uncharacterized protein n=1 Tax=Pyrus ussuriensis x Pyrus communis TaxID=2448454 RepID=A0A5N5H4Z2_9ROSA|nr:hypothetical protein D8674_024810 [Pyrus ussuriensis x Pyrus communis]
MALGRKKYAPPSMWLLVAGCCWSRLCNKLQAFGLGIRAATAAYQVTKQRAKLGAKPNNAWIVGWWIEARRKPNELLALGSGAKEAYWLLASNFLVQNTKAQRSWLLRSRPSREKPNKGCWLLE